MSRSWILFHNWWAPQSGVDSLDEQEKAEKNSNGSMISPYHRRTPQLCDDTVWRYSWSCALYWRSSSVVGQPLWIALARVVVRQIFRASWLRMVGLSWKGSPANRILLIVGTAIIGRKISYGFAQPAYSIKQTVAGHSQSGTSLIAFSETAVQVQKTIEASFIKVWVSSLCAWLYFFAMWGSTIRPVLSYSCWPLMKSRYWLGFLEATNARMLWIWKESERTRLSLWMYWASICDSENSRTNLQGILSWLNNEIAFLKVSSTASFVGAHTRTFVWGESWRICCIRRARV